MDSLRDFWAIVVEVWEEGLYGIDIGRIVVAVLIFFAFLLIRPLFSRIVINRVKSYTQKTETPLDDEVLGVVEKPLGFIPIVLGAFFAISHLSLTGQAQLVADIACLGHRANVVDQALAAKGAQGLVLGATSALTGVRPFFDCCLTAACDGALCACIGLDL